MDFTIFYSIYYLEKRGHLVVIDMKQETITQFPAHVP